VTGSRLSGYPDAVVETLALRTPRLLLRRWRPEDLAPFAALNADPVVMEHMPAPLSRADSDALAARITTGWNERGHERWAVEIPGVAPFIGFVGLSVPSFVAPFTPCWEVGWRLARGHWGQGFATEAAAAALAFAFGPQGVAGLDEVVSFTVPANLRSRAVMVRLGLVHDPAGDFEHPLLPPGHPLRRHVLHRLGRDSFAARARSGV
jgi:RimJ/RimL family protein N-acetyltransferase